MGIDTGSIGQLADTGDLISTMISWVRDGLGAADYFFGGDFNDALEGGFMY